MDDLLDGTGGNVSPPTRRCGLKSLILQKDSQDTIVTSYAEVWIEISAARKKLQFLLVTSYAEVWIEIT